jgi:hypothetical protein
LLFQLCLALGYPHPDYLKKHLTSKQLSEWMVYLDLEPIGYRMDYGFGLLTSMLYNINRKRGSRVFTAYDYYPYLKRVRALNIRKQSVESMREALLTIAAQINRQEEKRKRR